MWVVMRKPVLMEDAGRHFYVKAFEDRDEAFDWVSEQEGQYFGPSDYYIALYPEDGEDITGGDK
jgi:hypothetical protein